MGFFKTSASSGSGYSLFRFPPAQAPDPHVDRLLNYFGPCQPLRGMFGIDAIPGYAGTARDNSAANYSNAGILPDKSKPVFQPAIGWPITSPRQENPWELPNPLVLPLASGDSRSQRRSNQVPARQGASVPNPTLAKADGTQPQPFTRRGGVAGSAKYIRQMNLGSKERPYTNDMPLGSEPLGFLSEWRESRNRGVRYHHGYAGDRGAGGYGPWQLSTTFGVGSFLGSKWASKYASKFSGLRPGTQAFDNQYDAIAKQDPAGLRQAQHDYISNELYRPVADYAAAHGFDLTNQGIRESLWSIAVQHGKAKRILDMVIAKGGQHGDPTNVLRNLYVARIDYVASLGPTTVNMANIKRYAKEGKQIILHDSLVRRQLLMHQDLIDISNPQNYPEQELPR